MCLPELKRANLELLREQSLRVGIITGAVHAALAQNSRLQGQVNAAPRI